jgi:hypothetical protein
VTEWVALAVVLLVIAGDQTCDTYDPEDGITAKWPNASRLVASAAHRLDGQRKRSDCGECAEDNLLVP